MAFRGAVMNDVARDQFNANEIQIQNVYRDGKPGLHIILDPVDNAGHNRTDRTGPVARCHTGTREDVIAEIVRWVKHDKSRIAWINGPAGSGKSAIAQTIAERYAGKKRLAASFFFFRGAGNRSVFARFIPSLAYQLSVVVPSAKPFIEQTLQSEPTIMTNHSMGYQFDKLFVEPFLASKIPVLSLLSKPMIVVIDALDECNDQDLMAEFVDILMGAFQRNPRLNLRAIITSRVEEHIRKKLDTSAARLATHHLSLGDYHARLDIHKFLESSFTIIYEENHRRMNTVSLPWPSESVLDALVRKCDGSFIFAVTIIKFIQDGDGFPDEKVQLALGIDEGLDSLYTQVLLAAPKNENFQRVIGTVMLLSSPLPITALAELLQLRARDIIQALLGVQSILMIPGADNEPVRLFHTSLRDYLSLQSRSFSFFIDPPTRHLFIAQECLEAIKYKPEDGIFYTGNAQQYACLQWWHHVELGLKEAGANIVPTCLMDCMEKFASGSLDFWVNTMFWKQDRYQVLSSLKKLADMQGHLGNIMGRLEKHVQFEINSFDPLRQPPFPQDIRDWRNWQHKASTQTPVGNFGDVSYTSQSGSQP